MVNDYISVNKRSFVYLWWSDRCFTSFSLSSAHHIFHVPRNHLFNIPISLIQEIIQIMPPYSNAPVYKTGVPCWISRLSSYVMDTVGIALFKDIQLFRSFIEVYWTISTQRRHDFIFLYEFAHVIYRTSIHIHCTEVYRQPDYMRKAMDMEKVYCISSCGDLYHFAWWDAHRRWYWGIYRKTPSIGRYQAYLPDCREVSKRICQRSLRYLLLSKYHWITCIGNKLITEVLGNHYSSEQNLWRTLQRYDGMLQPREVSYSCEHRRQYAMGCNGVCVVVKTEGQLSIVDYRESFGDNQLYDPYCGQPTLQAIWDPTIMASSGLEGFLLDHYFPVRLYQR